MTKFQRLPRKVRAARFAGALAAHTSRYMGGFISRSTWEKHTRATRRRIEADGLTELVADILGDISSRRSR